MQHAAYADELMFLRKPQRRYFFISNFFPWASQNTAWLVLPLSGSFYFKQCSDRGQTWRGLSRSYTSSHGKRLSRAVTLPSDRCRHREATACQRQSQAQVQDQGQKPVSWVPAGSPACGISVHSSGSSSFSVLCPGPQKVLLLIEFAFWELTP